MPDVDSAMSAWRTAQVKKWDTIRKSFDKDFTAAAKNTNEDDARLYAAEKQRPNIRAFLYDVLRRSPKPSATDFLNNAPPMWIAETERLFDDVELVPRLIRRSYPTVWPWAKNITVKNNLSFVTDVKWRDWVVAFGAPLGYEVAEEPEIVVEENPAIRALNMLKPYVPIVVAVGIGSLVGAMIVRR